MFLLSWLVSAWSVWMERNARKYCAVSMGLRESEISEEMIGSSGRRGLTYPSYLREDDDDEEENDIDRLAIKSPPAGVPSRFCSYS